MPVADLVRRLRQRGGIELRHEGNAVIGWFCPAWNRGGDLASLCRMLRLPLPPAERTYRYAAVRHG